MAALSRERVWHLPKRIPPTEKCHFKKIVFAVILCMDECEVYHAKKY
jgi:hypothetical protein